MIGEPISVSLAPNLFWQDFTLACRWLFDPSKWFIGSESEKLEDEMKSYFKVANAVSFASGRTALLAILKALGIGRGDEVILQSFTCVVVANAIKAVGARPVFVDIEPKNFNLDVSCLKLRITSKTKAVIVQHTFGFPAKIDKILDLAQSKKIAVIEDCAHGIGIWYRKKLLGTHGRAAFFSFGRDKAISSTFGGLAICQDEALGKKIKEYQKSLSYPTKFWVRQQLLHPIIFTFLLPFYNFLFLGKLILVFSQWLKLVSFPVEKEEKKGVFPEKLLVRLPDPLASLALNQLKRLEKFNQARMKAVKFYASKLCDLPLVSPEWQIEGKEVPLLRFTVRTPRAQELYEYAKKRGVILNNWYYPAVSPVGVDYQTVGYEPSSCPNAEEVASEVVNLPTQAKISAKGQEFVVKVIREFFLNEERKLR